MSKQFPNRRIAILEAKRLANGASGRNGGMMLNGISFSDDSETVAREHALTQQTIDRVEALIREHGLRVRYRRDGCVHVATTQRNAEIEHAQVEQLAKLGLPLRFLSSSELDGVLRIRGACGAVFDAAEGLINGVDLIRAM